MEVDYSGLALPPGTDGDSLKLAVYLGGRWKRLPDSTNDPGAHIVKASLEHFTPYGLVPDPKEVSGRGQHWEANGVVVDTSTEHFARLNVSETAIGLFVSGESTASLSLTLAGLPTDGTHHVYVDSYANAHLVTPADGGTLILALDGTQQHFIWVQPQPGTVHLFGPGDGCEGQDGVGVRDGNTCTLTTDIEGDVSIDASGQVLDCNGHRISQTAAPGSSIGILVPYDPTVGSISDVTIRNCVIGGEDAEFWHGIAVNYGVNVHVLDSTFERNTFQIEYLSGSGALVAGNTFVCDGCTSVRLSGTAQDGRVENNSMTWLNYRAKHVGVDLMGVRGASADDPVTGVVVSGNAIDAEIAVSAVFATENVVTGNNMTGDVGLLFGIGGWPNRAWWNNIEATKGVISYAGPAEVSDGEGHGNWWGHTCPGLLFTAGVDSNGVSVGDSYPYGVQHGWEQGFEPGCDTTPPDAPVIDSPFDGATVLTLWPVFVGAAEPRSTVTVYEGATELGWSRATDEGRFVVELAAALELGEHTFYAVATDLSGNISLASEAVALTVAVVDQDHPLVGEHGKMRIIGLSDSPDPFDPARETNDLQVVVDVDAIKGLEGNTENWRYFALTKRTILDPDTMAPVKTLYGATEVDREAVDPLPVVVGDGWDGTDEVGQPVAQSRAYPFQVETYVVRVFVGTGEGPPCARDEEAATFGMSAIAAMSTVTFPEGWPPLWWQEQAVKCCIVDQRRQLLYAANGDGFAVPQKAWIKKTWDPAYTRAENCEMARLTCNAVQETDYSDAECLECYQECDRVCKDPNKPCKWPITFHSHGCGYWTSTIGGVKPPEPAGWPGPFPTQKGPTCQIWPQIEPDEAGACTYSCDYRECVRPSHQVERDQNQCVLALDKSYMDTCVQLEDTLCLSRGTRPAFFVDEWICVFDCARATCTRTASTAEVESALCEASDQRRSFLDQDCK